MIWLKDILYEAVKKLSRWQIFLLVFFGIILYFSNQLFKTWAELEAVKASRSVPEKGIWVANEPTKAGTGIDKEEIKQTKQMAKEIK